MGWFGFPALPAAVAARISQDVTQLMADPEVRSKLVDFGCVAQPLSPELTVAKIELDRSRYARTVRVVGIRLE